jgi:hypothetical protein
MVGTGAIFPLALAIARPGLRAAQRGVGLGLHWVVYSWIIRHPVGYTHATVRTVAVLAAWWMFPDRVVTACAVAVVLAYGVAIYQMATRRVPQLEGAE